ncbi:BglG family transcription antiterminator [Lactococcus nasutitermitis]|uniref:Ascorbate-specific PTS system EIIA component n=1 Tax=Lactococcus nasutitermitis TaxID=1652957 RepID=A0ABV9JBM9_9LACT|nr:PTS sugar transporter subunit IIA [Lactococcus nasutitermitis]
MIGYNLDRFFYAKQSFWKVEAILKETRLNKKELFKLVEAINRNLKTLNIREIEVQNNVLAFPQQAINLERVRFAIDNPYWLSIKKIERQSLIYLIFFMEYEGASVSVLKEFFETSKNTILADIKQLREELNLEKISINYYASQGFLLKGEEILLRKVAYQKIQNLTENAGYYLLSKILNENNPLAVSQTHQLLQEIIHESKLKIVYSRYYPLLFFTHLIVLRRENHSITTNLPHLVTAFDFRELELRASEKDYLTALIIGASDAAFQDRQLDFLYRISFQIMENIMKLAAMEFDDFSKTFDVLLAHLIPAYFRLTYNFELGNPLLSRIKQEYSELFPLVKNALKPLLSLTGNISEEELAYFVILFGSEIYKKRNNKTIKAIILCANGISSSLIMKKRLENLFPSMEFVLATSIVQLDEIPLNSYDVIFSTLEVRTTKKIYLFSPFPDEEEIRLLYNQVVQDLALPSFIALSAERILKLMTPFLKENVDYEEIKKILLKKVTIINNREKEKNNPMLSELLTTNTIQFTTEKLNWEEAIARAAQPLLDSGAIEETYIAAIINRIKEFGPFIDLGMGIALPHARPEDGVNKVGMSLLRCENPVNLLEDSKHEIKMFIVLSAVDNEAHLRALSSLTKILSNKDELQRLLNATTVAEIQTILATEERSE